MSILGINVSHFNGTIDWRAASESISFAYAKATQGTGFVDPCFRANWASMKHAKVPRGAYHFFEPAKDAVAQANFFLRCARFEEKDLPPVLDVETMTGGSGSNIWAGVARWLEVVRQATKKTPIVYTSAAFWQQIGNPATPGTYPLWAAHYDVKAPRIPSAWNQWAFWQFTQAGRCSGVEGYVDLNRFHGSLEDLRILSARTRPQAKLVA